MARHIELMEKIGAQGMSGDESDASSSRRFVTLKLSWRSSALTSFLWRLDEVCTENRNLKIGYRRVRGNAPRTRYHPTEPMIEENAQAPPGLPINCYDANWYKSLREIELVELGADMKAYDFSFSAKGKGRMAGDRIVDDRSEDEMFTPTQSEDTDADDEAEVEAGVTS